MVGVSAILLVQLVTCAMLTGLIWTIQILHYPAFARVPGNEFLEFHTHHSRAITYLVAPLMLTELACAIAWVAMAPSLGSSVGLTSVGLIWLSTFALSVPIHNLLGLGKDTNAIDRLVKTNWPRTVLWTLRLTGLVYLSMMSVLNGFGSGV